MGLRMPPGHFNLALILLTFRSARPYLFEKNGSGQFEPRPEIIDAPTTVIGWNQDFSIEADESIGRVTLVRVGAVTHSFNSETRFFNLPIPQTGNIVTVRSPATASIAPPGFYLLFVWNALGVPSIAKIIQIGQKLFVILRNS